MVEDSTKISVAQWRLIAHPPESAVGLGHSPRSLFSKWWLWIPGCFSLVASLPCTNFEVYHNRGRQCKRAARHQDGLTGKGERVSASMPMMVHFSPGHSTRLRTNDMCHRLEGRRRSQNKSVLLFFGPRGCEEEEKEGLEEKKYWVRVAKMSWSPDSFWRPPNGGALAWNADMHKEQTSWGLRTLVPSDTAVHQVWCEEGSFPTSTRPAG